MLEIKDNINKLIIIGVVIGLLIFLHFVGVLAPFENILKKGISYVQAPLYNAGQKIFISEKKLTLEELKTENEELQKQVEGYAVQISNLQQKEENQDAYKKQLEFLEKNDYQSVGAKIIGKSSEGYAQIYLINQGTNSGLEKDYPVITENGILIGKILQADENTSQVLLITSNLSKIGAQVQNENKSQGVVSGQHGLTIKMDLISKDEKLNKYDIVITSGLEEFVPKGLIIGQVENIESEESELFQSAVISPLIDYKEQSIVSIIIP
ncbi:MAG: rod shape-determining protein MreC [Patescibacteria group bacterium]